MKKKQSIVSWLLTIVTCLSMVIPAVAASPGLAPVNPAFEEALQSRARQPLSATGALPASSSSDTPAALRNVPKLGYLPAPVSLPHLKQQQQLKSSYSRTALLGLPTSYDLRPLGKVTPVRDQSTCGSCWAFGTFGSAESNLLTLENRDFSENNLKNKAGFDLGPCAGGNAYMSMAYLARLSGPVNESDDPYDPNSGVSPTGLQLQKIYTDVTMLPGRNSATDNDALKQAVMTYGGVMVSYYADNAYYDATHHAYYFNGSQTSNHAVTLAGWDDNYSASNFSTPPPGNGAFLIKNSWGSAWGESGYFWVSYYDTQMAYDESFVFKKPGASSFNRIYQYDPLGWTTSYGYNDTTGWFSNVFTASGSDSLKAVSFYAGSMNTTYQVEVYTNVTGGPTSGVYRGTTTGTMTEAGYHTVTLSTPVALTAGQKFSVVVKVTTPLNNFPIPIEYPYAGYSSTVTASAGQSYVSHDGSTWTDITTQYSTTNVCLKAFTVAADNGLAPTVTSVSPAANTTGVATTSAVTATFSESMNAATITTASFYLNNGVSGAVSYNADTMTATFTPSAPLATGTTYTATITTAVKDAGGTPMASAKSWSFTTAAAAPLTFDELTPSELAPIQAGYGGFTWTNIYTFAGMSAEANSGYQHGIVTAPNVAFNGYGNQGMVASATPFTFNSAYLTAAWNNGLSIQVRGYRNNILLYDRTVTVDTAAPTKFDFNFSNVDQVTFDSFGGTNGGYVGTGTHFVMDNVVVNVPVGPVVQSTLPAANAGNVSVKTPVKAVFAASVKASTVTASTFKVNGVSAVTGTVTYDDATHTATFAPSAALAANTQYTATVTTGVTDNNGKPLAGNFSWTFTTGASNTVSGTVHSGGLTGPVLAGATVTLGGLTATTSSTGAFTLTGVPNGTFTLTITKSGYTTFSNESFSVSGNQTGLNFYIIPMYSVTGTVHTGSATGAGLAGATVSVAGKTAVTSSTGAFSITGILPGTYTLTVVKAGYNTYSNAAYAVSGNRTESGLFLVPITYTMSGFVRTNDQNMAPIASATVAIAGKTGTTSSTGAYSIAGIAPGTYTLTASKTGYAPVTVTSYTVGSNQTGVNIFLTPAYTVGGVVHAGSPTGALLSGASVTLAGKTFTTTSTGAFSFAGVPAGTYTLSISAPNYSTYTTGLVVNANMTTLSYYVTTTPLANLVPYKDKWSSDKLVIAPTSQQSTNYTGTQFYTTDTLYMSMGVANTGTGDTATTFGTALYIDGVLTKIGTATDGLAKDGSIVFLSSLGQLPAGTHTIKMVVDYLNAVTEASEADNSYTKTISVITPPTYSMAGTVRTGSLTGLPVAGATVSIAGKSAVTSSTGTFSITGVPAGTYTLTISKSGYTTYTDTAYRITGAQSALIFILNKQSAALTLSLLPETSYGDRLWSYDMELLETAGVGVTIETVTWKYYDANNVLIGSQTADGTYFANWFGNGSTHISAYGYALGTIHTDLGGRTSGSVVITFSGTDDNGNKVSASKKELLSTLLGQAPLLQSGAGTTFGAPKSWK